jgi:hypothetical protein
VRVAEAATTLRSRARVFFGLGEVALEGQGGYRFEPRKGIRRSRRV